MRRSKYSLCCFLIILFFAETSRSQSYTNNPSVPLSFHVSNVNIALSVQHPARLSVGEIVKVTVDYTTNISGNLRVLVEPMTNGSPSPGYYSPHQARNYDAKSGKAAGQFTVSQDNVTVDQVQVSIVAANNITFFKKSVPVQLHFSNSPMQQSIVGASSQSPCDEKVKRTISPDGSIEITYFDGTKKILDENGDGSIIYPDGRKEEIIKPQAQHVAGAGPVRVPDQESKLNAINEDLMRTISRLVDEDRTAVDHYRHKEDSIALDLYEKMKLRIGYINQLITNDNFTPY